MAGNFPTKLDSKYSPRTIKTNLIAVLDFHIGSEIGLCGLKGKKPAGDQTFLRFNPVS